MLFRNLNLTRSYLNRLFYMDLRSLFNIFPLAFLLTLGGLTAKAQGMDPVFSQFYAAPIYLNPAFAGSTACSRIALSQRLISGPENFYIANFSYDTYVRALYGGVGLMITSDQSNMYMMRNSINAMYAYHLRLTDNVNINFGVQAGYIGNYSRWGRFKFPVDEPEPDNTWKSNVDFAAGMMLFSDVVYGGIAVHHLHEPNMSLYSEGSSPLYRKYTAHIGFYREPSWGTQGIRRDGPEYFFSPNFIFQVQGDLAGNDYYTHSGFGLYFGRKPIMIGLWHRIHWLEFFSESIKHTSVAHLGLNIDDYRVGISYDFESFSADSNVNFSKISNVVEITFAMRFGCR